MDTNGTSRAVEARKAVKESLNRVLEPVKAEVAEITERIDALEAEVSELKTVRMEAVRVVRAIEPNYMRVAKLAPKSTRKDASGNSERIREAARMIEDLLRAGRGRTSDGITQTSIDRELDGYSTQTIRPALELLVDSGVLRLDHKVRGGGKAYALVNG